MIGRIFGSEKAVDKGIGMLDDLVHTSQEKSNAQRSFLRLYEPFKLTQRLIALTAVPVYVLAWSCGFVMSMYGMDTTEQDRLLEGRMGDMVTLIAAFYFGGGAAESVFKFLINRPNKSK